MTTSRPRVLIEDWLPVAELGIESRREVVELYRAWLPGELARGHRALRGGRVVWLPLDLSELRGKDLVCWCPADRPCHADVLLELANRGS